MPEPRLSAADREKVAQQARRDDIDVEDTPAREAEAERRFVELYMRYERIEAEPPSLAQIPVIDQIERELHGDLALEDLTPRQAGHHATLSVAFARRRAQIYAGLGLDDDAKIAFDAMRARAEAADRAAPEERQHPYALLTYANWLAGRDADDTLRLLLPVIDAAMERERAQRRQAAATGRPSPPPTADDLELQGVLAAFFARHGDMFEAQKHVAWLRRLLQTAALIDSDSQDYVDVVESWALRALESERSAVQRTRLFYQALLSYVALHNVQAQIDAADQERVAAHDRAMKALFRLFEKLQAIASDDRGGRRRVAGSGGRPAAAF